MDLKQLNYFVQIVQEGNISAAAKKLHISQPPLSYQMKMLEEELEVQLLKRGSRIIELTDAGRLLYQKALVLLELNQSTKREIEDYKNGMEGTLRLGVISSSGAALLDYRMYKYHQLYPKIRFDLHEGNTYELLEMLQNGVIEIAVCRTPFNQRSYNCLFLEKEPLLAVWHPDFPFVHKGDCLEMKDLKNQPLIFYRRFESLIVSACYQAGFEPETFCCNEDARTSLMWAQAQLGIALIPASVYKKNHQENCCTCVINDEQLLTQVTIVWRKDLFVSKIAENFLSLFENG